MDVINSAILTVNMGIRYLKGNWWPIVCLLAALYVLKTQFVDKRGTGSPGYTLSSASSGSTRSTARGTSTGTTTTGSAPPAQSKEAKDRQEEMREIRLRQQEIANQRHLEAEKLRKQKKEEERARKNKVAQATINTSGDNRLGGDAAAARDGFNPMQPWTGSTGGYRAQRRSTRRG